MRTPDEAKDIARRFVEEVFNQRNLKHAEEMLADDFVEHSPFPGLAPDKAGAIESFRLALDASDDLRAEIIDLISDGDRIAIRARYVGTDTGGSAPGVPPTGKAFDVEGIDVAFLGDDGRFREHYGILDVATMMQQLGLVPTPEGPPPS